MATSRHRVAAQAHGHAQPRDQCAHEARARRRDRSHAQQAGALGSFLARRRCYPGEVTGGLTVKLWIGGDKADGGRLNGPNIPLDAARASSVASIVLKVGDLPPGTRRLSIELDHAVVVRIITYP